MDAEQASRLPKPTFSAELFARWQVARRGAVPAEDMSNPVWEWLFRGRVDPYHAARLLATGTGYPRQPRWAGCRMGQSQTGLADGRTLWIAGEHEDFYDPDFYIYNDVIVEHPDGRVEIRGYPAEVFPPTDFHSATAIDQELSILIIGSIGYQTERDEARTPVFRLNTHDYQIRAVETTGTPPGWIHKHTAELSPDGRRITLRGGQVMRGQYFIENIDDGSDGQIESLEGLRTGKLQALCVVDMFNEGLDIPAVDRVIMLRPTESKVIFLQQLGRGLRAAVGKTRLLVIDFVGNHRIFARRMLHLLSFAGKDADWSALKTWLLDGTPSLPQGCLLEVELSARDLITKFIPEGATAALETYRTLRDELGRRPHAIELEAQGILPRTLARQAGNWFAFVASEGDLTPDETNAFEDFSQWLVTVETTSLNKCYKMAVLRVLLDQRKLFEPVDLNSFARQFRRFLLQHPVLRNDVLRGKHAIDHATASDSEWARWWRKWPIQMWLDVQNGRSWFQVKDGVFRFNIDCPAALKDVLEAMTEELVDWRLAAYSKSHRLADVSDAEASFEGKVSHSGERAILFLPEPTKAPQRPTGPTNVRLPDGRDWEFKMVKVACNVAKPIGDKGNQLSELLRGWFGQQAGLPGTDFRVLFDLRDGQWNVRPIGASSDAQESREKEEIAAPDEALVEHENPKWAEYTTHVPVYDLIAAAGYWGPDAVPEAIGWMRVKGAQIEEGMFAAWVQGDSMEPKIRNGCWCLFRPCPNGSRQDKLLLVQIHQHHDPVDGGRFTVKRYRSSKQMTEDGWQHESIALEPLNPKYQPIKITAENADDLKVVGEFVRVLD